MFDNALCVANALNTQAHDGKKYYIKTALRDEPLDSITIKDNPKKAGYTQLAGVTFGNVLSTDVLDKKRYTIEEGQTVPADKKKWVEQHTIDSSDPYPAKRQKAIEKLRHTFYTFADDVCEETIASTKPDITAESFSGPKVTFAGSPTATLMTNIYYENANGLLERIDDKTGMVHESAFQSTRFDGFGGWIPGWGGYHDTAYTRLRALTLLGNMGFETKVNTAIAFFDKWLMYWPKAYPEIQLGGKPVPGHATVIANKPHIYFDELSKAGWPTKYKTRDFGNPENDGHGLLMLTRWRAWIKQGRTKEWIDTRWEAINEAAEYIRWALDNPELSFSEHGLLYNESEGGMQKASMYCDFPCYLGLLAYAEMAEQSGRTEKAKRWKLQAKRLFDAMETYYPTTIEPWGNVWNPKKNGMYNYLHSTLAPACVGMDYYGYDVMNKLPDDWQSRTERTYQMQLTKNEPPYAATAGMGYGQGYITQTALLMDKMADASQMVDWMAKVCFAPRQEHPYRVPEGSIISDDSLTWRRWGDLGNLYQLAEVVYTIHLILGIDDLNPDELIIMPRLPLGWKNINLQQWPVRTTSNNISKTLYLDMKIKRTDNSIKMDLDFSESVDSFKVRFGPFGCAAENIEIQCNSNKRIEPLEQYGDSKWTWIEFTNGKKRSYEISAKATK